MDEVDGLIPSNIKKWIRTGNESVRIKIPMIGIEIGVIKYEDIVLDNSAQLLQCSLILHIGKNLAESKLSNFTWLESISVEKSRLTFAVDIESAKQHLSIPGQFKHYRKTDFNVNESGISIEFGE